MVPTCRGDPVACIDFAVLFVGEFLKDWTTMALLAILLGLLLKLRSDQATAREFAYAMQMQAYDDRRNGDQAATGTWEIKDGKLVER